jgi:hypothetical protein
VVPWRIGTDKTVVDWLLDSDPSIRWQAMKELVERLEAYRASTVRHDPDARSQGDVR